jgi:PadR family transcriptional regulator, regulatory protein PadR
MAPRLDLLRGTLDLLVLQTLALGPNHGVGVARRIQQVTRNTFDVGPGSLFPALHRLEEKGWLKSSWGYSENNRKAKYYRLTPAGRRQLEAATATWERIAQAVAFSAKSAREGKA